MRFADRADAGRQLARELTPLDLTDPVVLALPRGGVPVAYEVARVLAAPLDVLVARKIGAPFQPELGVGAIAEGGVTFLDQSSLASLGLSEQDLAATIELENAELQRRVTRYRGDRPAVPLQGRTVVVVDDGLATGVTARAALRAARTQGPQRLILAVPVGPPDAAGIIGVDADEVVVAQAPRRLSAVGQWYDDFSQTADAEVTALLEQARARPR